MDIDAYPLNLSQPALFEYAPVITGAVELFPTVWSAAEDLTCPDADTRRAGLCRLQELGAPRLSPLVAYLLATRLTDPDLEVRTQAISMLGDLFIPDPQGRAAPDEVRRHLSGYLVQMRTRTIFALLEAVVAMPSLERHGYHLIRSCPFAGSHLIDILTEKQNPPAIRKQAAYYLGVVGFLEAIPALERLVTRLESRRNGQQLMNFAAPAAHDDIELLPAVQKALTLLKAP
jgi:HEAT repeat protein